MSRGCMVWVLVMLLGLGMVFLLTPTPWPPTAQNAALRPHSNGEGEVQPTPRNCATAVARGLSEIEAARHPHLDRDKDGVACYGD